MAIQRVLIVAICAILTDVQYVVAEKEVVGIVDSATDLNHEEIDALRPLFEELQSQYDYIISQSSHNGDETDDEMQALYESTRSDLEEPFQSLLKQQPAPPRIVYDTTLPTVAELIGDFRGETPTAEQLAELEDMESLLQETLNEAQSHIDALVRGAVRMEGNLIKINKHKIAEYVYKALSVLFGVSTRVRRAAYCTYSHGPQLNESLNNVFNGVDCYTYSAGLVLRIQLETVHAVSTIRADVVDMAAVFKKAATKKSTLGKIATLILNLTKIVRDIRETYSVATNAAEALQNELPDAAKRSLQCGTDFAATIPQMIATVSNLTTCITFVDDTIPDYDFLRPEAERDFN